MIPKVKNSQRHRNGFVFRCETAPWLLQKKKKKRIAHRERTEQDIILHLQYVILLRSQTITYFIQEVTKERKIFR